MQYDGKYASKMCAKIYYGLCAVLPYNKQLKSNSDVVLWEVLPIKNEQDIILKFISTNSKYRQGVRLAIDSGEGCIEINGICSREMYLWEDTSPNEVFIKCTSSSGFLSIYNVFDVGEQRGGRKSQMDSCGMVVEKTDGKLLYKCNDAGFETNFDKLIFQIELL